MEDSATWPSVKFSFSLPFGKGGRTEQGEGRNAPKKLRGGRKGNNGVRENWMNLDGEIISWNI